MNPTPTKMFSFCRTCSKVVDIGVSNKVATENKQKYQHVCQLEVKNGSQLCYIQVM